jgi:hypothetical protein
MVYDFWTIDQDVLVDIIRDEPRFKTMRLELDQRIGAMRQNVQQADLAG